VTRKKKKKKKMMMMMKAMMKMISRSKLSILDGFAPGAHGCITSSVIGRLEPFHYILSLTHLV
jgi:hypothetical protein